MKILHLTVKKQWFDLIASGEKKEEYREMKMYWAQRLQKGFPSTFGIDTGVNVDWNEFDEVHFRNGYGKNVPLIKLEFKGIEIGQPTSGLSEEGMLDRKVFVIKLGNIIN